MPTRSYVDKQLMLAITQLAQVFRSLQIREGKSTGLSPIQVQIVLYLDQHPGETFTLSNLTREFHISKASLSESVQNLMSKNLITKRAEKLDRRSHIIGLTSKGKKVAQKAWKNAETFVDFFQGMKTKDKLTLYNSLLKVIEPARSKLSL